MNASALNGILQAYYPDKSLDRDPVPARVQMAWQAAHKLLRIAGRNPDEDDFRDAYNYLQGAYELYLQEFHAGVWKEDASSEDEWGDGPVKHVDPNNPPQLDVDRVRDAARDFAEAHIPQGLPEDIFPPNIDRDERRLVLWLATCQKGDKIRVDMGRRIFSLRDHVNRKMSRYVVLSPIPENHLMCEVTAHNILRDSPAGLVEDRSAQDVIEKPIVHMDKGWEGDRELLRNSEVGDRFWIRYSYAQIKRLKEELPDRIIDCKYDDPEGNMPFHTLTIIRNDLCPTTPDRSSIPPTATGSPSESTGPSSSHTTSEPSKKDDGETSSPTTRSSSGSRGPSQTDGLLPFEEPSKPDTSTPHPE